MNWIFWLIVAALVIGVLVFQRASFISADKARQLLQQGALVIDVRGPDEFNSRHLPGALNMPMGSLSAEVPRRFPDKNQPLLLHCVSGTRSGIARRQLAGMGYKNAFNLGSYGRAEGIVRQAQRK